MRAQNGRWVRRTGGVPVDVGCLAIEWDHGVCEPVEVDEGHGPPGIAPRRRVWVRGGVKRGRDGREGGKYVRSRRCAC